MQNAFKLVQLYHAKELEAVPEVVGHELVQVLAVATEPTVNGTTQWGICPLTT